MSPRTFGCGQSVPTRCARAWPPPAPARRGCPRRTAACPRRCGPGPTPSPRRPAGPPGPAARERPVRPARRRAHPAHVVDHEGQRQRAQRGSSPGSWAPSRCRHRCQPSGAIRPTTWSKTAGSGAPPRWGTKLKRAPRTPASCNARTDAGVASAPAAPRRDSGLRCGPARPAARHGRRRGIGLHHHGAADAQVRVQRGQPGLRRVGRRGTALGIREHVGRPEHMAMGIAGARRQGVAGTDGDASGGRQSDTGRSCGKAPWSWIAACRTMLYL